MADYFDSLAQKFMNKSSLSECSLDEIRKIVQQYPYFAPAHFLLLKKLDKNSDEYRQQYGKAILYYHNPLEFEQLFQPEKYETNYSFVDEFEPAEVYEEIGLAQDIAEAKPIEEISEDVETTSDESTSDEVTSDVIKTEENIYEHQEAEEITEPEENFHEEETEEIIEEDIEEEKSASIINFEEEKVEIKEEEENQPDTIEATSEEILFDKNALIDAAVEEMQEPESTVEIGTEEMPVDEYDIDEPEQEEITETENEESTEEKNDEPEEQVTDFSKEKENEELEEEKIEDAPPPSEPEKENKFFEIKPLVDEPASELVFEPFHTVDYFASQGIKLSHEEAPQDKFGKQVKSFTEWLKTMKRLPAQKLAQTTDAVTEKKVETMATHSVADPDVITEAMAEVWIKQGNFEKATEVYNKLSLLNPSKRAYFAAKIENLNRS